MLRLESKISGEHLVEMADEVGIPLMFGWMCCNQWEKWSQWDDEDQRVSQDSLRSQILMLRHHPSAFVWANGSDGRPPPPPVLAKYRAILTNLHWQNATVDTVSSFATRRQWRTRLGRHPHGGPYSWRPPTYWFSGRYGATRGSTAEQGDNEHIPPFASLEEVHPARQALADQRRMVLPCRLDPNNEPGDQYPARRRPSLRFVEQREEFTRKAQLAHYESTRAQFEAFAANGWDTHKMTIYWMLNSHWPSFFGNIFDYYLRPGWGLLRRQEGAAAVVGGVRLVRDRRPHEGQRDRGEPDTGRPAGPAGAGARLRPAGQRCAKTGAPTTSASLRRNRRGDDIAAGRPRLKSLLRAVRTARQRRNRRCRERLLAVAAARRCG